jgi:hypothetical protein
MSVSLSMTNEDKPTASPIVAKVTGLRSRSTGS